ncbi:gpi-anchored cell surface glycoprotein [Purpureocillium lavendulum]|uniref:Gpi-anchored cell surface glycoprotein n=1 Tax=Purpureocillium lavendulum TaxID=1247861 RepID=A0AB34FLX2_9HYPO|nr:gpi-anchored cell surface glycoprotein [Purpureocillium lavendulum]
MSLNGLDEAKVVEAHEAATSEPGGWYGMLPPTPPQNATPSAAFLLKYASRDEVELLSRGNGGIVEVRNAVAEYDETSPLYGFLKYRRRNVIIKYLPEDCSRIIQARVAVHFNAVCERFSPYDTAFEISAATELKDTKLSAACSLHAASCSTSSSTSSLRRRRLMEIAEEEGEEEQRAMKRQSMQDRDGDRPQLPAGDSPAVKPVTLNSQLAESPEHRKFSAASTSELPTFVGIDDRPTSPRKSSDADSTRLDYQSSYSSYPYTKPKVKLGPRPSLETSGRPQTAGNFRPVSAIPPGFKLFGKGSRRGKGSRDGISIASPADDTASLNFTISETPAAEESLQAQESTVARPSTSSGAAPAPDPVSMSPPAASKKPTISPEKARLMKAMKLREKKKKMSMQPPAAETVSEAQVEDNEGAPTESALEPLPEMDDPAETEQGVEDESPNADQPGSATYALASSLLTDQTSDLTQPDSRPTSPIVASSEAAQSTKASSISESTDETVRAKDEETSPDDRPAEEATSKDEVRQESQPESREMPAQEDINEDNAAPMEAGEREPVATETAAVETTSELDEPQETATAAPAGRPAEAAGPASEDVEDVLCAGDEPGTSEEVHEDGDDLSSVALPISRFSTSIPLPPQSPQNPLSTNVDAETSSIPTTDAAEEPATSTIDNEALPSTQPKTLETVSTQDLLAAAKVASQPTVVSGGLQQVLEGSPVITKGHATVTEVEEHDDDSDTDTIPAQVERSKRRAVIEPIRTNLTHSRNRSHSEADLSDDEELMNELQSATVQEAKPMLVAKTPVSATFPPSPIKRGTITDGPTAHMVRTASNPIRGKLTVPTGVSQPSTRSVSTGAAYLQHVNQQHQQQGGNMVKKSNLGSSISQRIKALEKLSASSGGDAPAVPGRERPSSTFFAVKKREPSRSPSVMDRANSFRSTAEPPSQSNESSPDGKHGRVERSGSVTSRLSVFESPTTANPPNRSPASTHRGRPESVSVTARIIRDPNDKSNFGFGPAKDPSEYSHLELMQSPLLVDHQKAIREPAQLATEGPLEDRSTSQESGKAGKPRQSSLSIVKDFIKERRRSVTSNQGDALGAQTGPNPSRSPTRPPSLHQNNSFSPRLSISSRRSSFSKDRDGYTSPTGDSFGDDAKSANGDKKLSRAGRFMRRLSNLGSRGKNSPTVLSPTVAEDRAAEAATQRPATTGSPSVVSYMGDVNVQFPDNLLWKRRNMCLDSQGFLVLSTLPAQSGRQAQGTKRYHLSEFRAPYTPDVEIQELPNSVVLDFIEGASIQIACEDRAGQMNVLNILQEAHATRSTTYGL